MLNREQKSAVIHESGPLLIIAGAGTGKTHVITSRILYLIESGRAKPDEILALTFTEKASREMVERLDLAFDLGYEEPCVKTFHAFSDGVLRESGLEIGVNPGFKILSQANLWFFFKKHLFEFNLDYYRPSGNPNYFIYAILQHFSRLKDELITPGQYIEYAERFGVEGEDSEEREKTLEIARVYQKYQELLLKNNYMDFGDLTYFVVELLNKRESVLDYYQKKFKYILVDEFQDTNYAQFQLVMMLAGSHKNISVVGDDDQSIYKWRGASLSNILQFEKNFPDNEKVVLTGNYRSSQAILDASYNLIQNNNPDRLEVKSGIDKKLKSQVGDGEAVEIHHFPNFVQEAEFVAGQIESLKRAKDVNFRDFAILVRANQLAHPFVDELKYRGIPYSVKNPKGLFVLDEIKDLIALLRFLVNPKDDISCLRILKTDVFGIEMAEILDLLHNPTKEPLFAMLGSDEIALPGLESALASVKRLLDELLEFSRKNPAGPVINEFLKKSGYLKYLIENEKFEELDHINEFAKHVAQFEGENDSNGVYDFVNYLDLLEEANVPLAYEDISDRDAVQILTIHGSKGLEFPYVFVTDAVKGRFPTTNRREAFVIPESLTKEIFPEGDFHLQEERRLFYVAMTRAKQRLMISYSDRYEGNKLWKRSPFVDEIVDNGGATLTNHEETEDMVKKLRDYKQPNKPIFDLPPFDRKRLSYSQFNLFQTCPLKYNYAYLMKVPSYPSHAANFGSSVHDTLNAFYQLLKRGRQVNLEILKELYEKYWIGYGYESKAHENTRKKKGFEMLEAFYTANRDSFAKVPAFLERPFNLKVDDVLVSGRIDRIDKKEDGTFEVIDYKTGKFKKDVNLDKDLQLSVYALACRDIFHLNVSKLSLYFIEGNKKVSTIRSDEQMDAVRGEIMGIVEEMRESKFDAAPGFHCGFCDYRLICPAL